MKCSSTGEFLWARSEGGPGAAHGQDIAVDAQGNSVIVGMLGGIPIQQAIFGNTTFPVRGFAGFAVKHDAAGNILWASQLGSDNTNYSTSVALDRAGNAYVAGVYSSALPAWGPGVKLPYPGGNKNVYTVKYNPQGKVLAAQREGACGGAYYPFIAVTATQDIFLAGFFAGPASFVSTLFGKTGGQLFIARLGDLSTPSTPDNFACGTASAPAPTPPAPTPRPPPRRK
ncbi:MAG: SBBP repeat-containing protein [Hymenobacter sp.]